MNTLIALLLSAACIHLSAPVAGVDRQRDLSYRDRGDRYEGVKGTPVSDRAELISAVVDYRERVIEMPARFKLKFYLKERTSVFVTVREIDNKRDYWLDNVRPQGGWQAGFGNEFLWPTAEVIKPLGGIQLDGLGAVVRLDNDEPSMDVRVAPAILYHARPPKTAPGYLFTFKIGRKAEVTCSFSKDEDNSRVISTEKLTMLGHRPRTVSWNASRAREGWYRLRINVVYSDNGQEVNNIVHFYHRPSVK